MNTDTLNLLGHMLSQNVLVMLVVGGFVLALFVKLMDLATGHK